jgi:hypothetical protein
MRNCLSRRVGPVLAVCQFGKEERGKKEGNRGVGEGWGKGGISIEALGAKLRTQLSNGYKPGREGGEPRARGSQNSTHCGAFKPW